MCSNRVLRQTKEVKLEVAESRCWTQSRGAPIVASSHLAEPLKQILLNQAFYQPNSLDFACRPSQCLRESRIVCTFSPLLLCPLSVIANQRWLFSLHNTLPEQAGAKQHERRVGARVPTEAHLQCTATERFRCRESGCTRRARR